MSHTPNNTAASSASGSPAGQSEHRRGFFVKATAAVIGAILVVFPFAAGLVTFFSPLTKKSKNTTAPDDEGGFIPVTTLDAIPADGSPKRFAIITDLDDAWTHYNDVPIGSVYLRRDVSSGKVKALSTICPHAGCFVNFDQQASEFKCPCHNSFFKLDGAIIQPSPSPREMDCLDVKEEIKNGVTEILVKYEKFYTGIAEKKVKS
jgi:menaquinol-cytochrome c reductase iron-sulfur subunit